MDNFKVSLIKGTAAQIDEISDFRAIVRKMLKDETFQQQGKALREAAQNNHEQYDRLKRKANGFVIGEFSYRNAESCISYQPFLGFDIDHIDDKSAFDDCFNKLKKWPFTYVLMPSLSGMGLRVIVRTDSDQSTHKKYYAYVCDLLNTILGIPTKTKIRNALKDIGHGKDYIEKHLSENTHIDDVTSDISRFWFYSGIEAKYFFANKESQVIRFKPKDQAQQTSHKPTSTGSDYAYTFTEQDKVEFLLKEIERTSTDITKGVSDWFKIGLALYDEFGTQGEDYFYRASQFHPDYSSRSASREWSRVQSKFKANTVSIGSFYQWCADYGLNIDFNKLVELHSDKFEKSKAERRKVVKQQQVSETLQDGELEKSILATCIYSPENISSIYDSCPKFAPAVFTDELHFVIFDCIRELESNRMAVNRHSVANKAKFKGAENVSDYLSEIKPFEVDILSLITNCDIAYNLYIKRQIVLKAREIESEVKTKDIDAFDYISEISNDYAALSDMGAGSTQFDGLQLAQSVANRYDLIAKKRKESNSRLTGVTSGLSSEDNITSGYQDTDLIILAARPGMGKTSKALLALEANGKKGIPVGMFSLEMSAEQLGRRVACLNSEVSASAVKDGEMSDGQASRFFNTLESMSGWPIYIDDKGGANLMHIDRISRKWKRNHDIKLIIIDYLQLITLKGKESRRQNRDTQIGEITKHLKALAKDLHVPIILLSQLSRAVETRGGSKRPQLSDLRESGNIEQDADIVSFLYRPEYYDMMEDEEGNSLKGVAEIIYAKHRGGSLSTAFCKFVPELTKFKDGDYRNDAPQSTPEHQQHEAPAYNIPNQDYSVKPAARNDDDDIPF